MAEEAMNISISRDDAENITTEDVDVDVRHQKVVFKSSPRKSVSRPDDVNMMSPDRIKSPLKRKILADKQPETEGSTEPQDTEEPTFKKARFTREALRAAYSAPYFTAPVTWAADAGSDGSALYLGENSLIVGTKDGRVLHMDFEGHVKKVQQLPLPIGSLIKDGSFLYAWCPARYSFDNWKGALYDLNPDVPRFLFDVQNLGEWMTMATVRHGMLILGDDKGSLALLGANGEVNWFKEATDARGTSKLLLADESGIYYGHRKKVVKYSLQDGEEMWTYQATGRHVGVHQGIMDKDHIFAETGAKVVKLSKDDGTVVEEYAPLRHRASNVCIGSGFLITGSCPTVLFDLDTAEERFRMNFAGRLNDAIMSMHSSGRLFAVWDKIYCMDLRPEAVQRAVEGKSIRTREITVDEVAPDHTGGHLMVKTTESGGGVTLEVVENEDGSIRIQALDGLYESTWPIRFPKPLQIPGRKYVVDGLVSHDNYEFYSIQGEIKELVTSLPPENEEPIEASEECTEGNSTMEQPKVDETEQGHQDTEARSEANQENNE